MERIKVVDHGEEARRSPSVVAESRRRVAEVAHLALHTLTLEAHLRLPLEVFTCLLDKEGLAATAAHGK